jgi:hypothetical protein
VNEKLEWEELDKQEQVLKVLNVPNVRFPSLKSCVQEQKKAAALARKSNAKV